MSRDQVYLLIVILAGCLLIAYPASIGPVALIEKHGWVRMNRDALRAIYWPVIWAHDNTPLKKPLEMYVDVWEKF
jgi:hypothetical protein